MTPERAETVALRALAWIAGEDDLLHIFLGSTGATAEDLRTRAGSPEFLVSVLEFLLMDDGWVVAFCDAEGFDYEGPQRALAALPGGAAMHWT